MSCRAEFALASRCPIHLAEYSIYPFLWLINIGMNCIIGYPMLFIQAYAAQRVEHSHTYHAQVMIKDYIPVGIRPGQCPLRQMTTSDQIIRTDLPG